MDYQNEYATFKKILALSADEICSNFKQKDLTLRNGKLFVSYKFTLYGIDGYISATFSIPKRCYTTIDMDYNFCRPAGLNNYDELKEVISHIITNHK